MKKTGDRPAAYFPMGTNEKDATCSQEEIIKRKIAHAYE